MMSYQLTLTSLLERAGKIFPDVEIVSKRPDDRAMSYRYQEFYRRARSFGAVLQDFGIRPGDRVATLMWNHHVHLEVYFAIPSVGGVLHTLNLRLHPDELSYIVNHAEDRFLVVDDILLPLFEKIKKNVNLERVIVNPFGGGGVPSAYHSYEALVQSTQTTPNYAELSEQDPAAMCYTSGTTGKPKGVVYSHRALALHSYSISLPDNFSLSRHDTILPAMSMFHANAWGIPFAAVMNGSKLVLPGPNLQPEAILDLLSTEQVTFTGAVPTVWLGVVDKLEKEPGRWKLREGLRIAVAGSSCPETLFRRFDKFGVKVIQPWGMTETTPIATVCTLKPHMDSWGEVEKYALRAKQGVPSPFIDIRATDGVKEVAWDGQTPGELELRGPFVADSYYNQPDAGCSWTIDGWFRTGDVVTIDADGYVKITDRTKDLIKSGGEWISSIDVENALVAHPDVAEAAVISVWHPKWQERPLGIVVTKPGKTIACADLHAFLLRTFAKWQLPDDFVFVEELPHTSTGKLLKSELRRRYQDWNRGRSQVQ
ncbi:MAG TPA: long-chain fatty acid--CoA ligase [Candidatus Saccharimonadales bacterium]|nr:long-chain fatty acid--CoA ligase [Candidatus Saccharimonadales bacterium]